MRRTGESDEATAASDKPAVRNELSGTAGAVVQVGHQIGDVVVSLPPPPPRPALVPRQVPAADRYFVNRTDELARLTDLGERRDGGPGARISMVSGMPGVGKTALARQVAELVGRQFDDGELFVDFAALRSRVGGAAAVGEALAACLRDLGVSGHHIPASTQDRANLFRTCTAQRSVLLVLDDVTEPRQVRDLLPKGPGSVVLATSGHRLGELISFDGAELVMLDRLEPHHAHQVLVAVCGTDRVAAEPSAAAELIRLCDRLPIALRVAAARLVVEPTMTVAELVGEVRDSLDALSVPGQDGVSGVLTAAYQALPDNAKRLYRIFGALPGLEFTPDLAAVALDLPMRAARPAFTALHTANLVEDRDRPRRRFLGLVAQHAAAVAQGVAVGDDTAALERIAEHYVTRAVFADCAVMTTLRLRPFPVEVVTARMTSPFDGVDAAAKAQRWFAAERTNLMAALRLCVTRGWHEQTMQLASSLNVLHLNQRSSAALIEVSTLGARAAATAGRPDVQVDMLVKVSRGYLDQKRLEPAKQVLDEALSVAERCDQLARLASVWEHLGRYYDEVDLEQAITAYHQSIDLNRQAAGAGDPIGPRGAALATYFLGCSLSRSARYDEALTALKSARDELRALQDDRMAARALAQIGATYRQLGRYEDAAAALLEAVQAFAARGAVHYEGEALETLADVAERLGDRDGAQRSLTRAAQILEASGSPRAAELWAQLDPPADQG